MKRKVLFVASLFLATATFAQDGLTSKKGEAYLPEAGDWSIGFDASSLTGFVGNMMGQTDGANALNSGGWMNGTVGQEIRFKMFKDEKTAYRLRARIGFGGTGQDYVGIYNHDAQNADAGAKTDMNDYILNEKVSNGFNLVLGAGLEKRRGNTRIQGYYGGEVFIGLLGGKSTKYDDGRGLSADWDGSDMNTTDANSINNTAIITSVNTGQDSATVVTASGERTTEMKNGSTFTVGLQGFIGVEWFFAPKVSIGAEYTWGLSMSSIGEGETSTEKWGFSDADNSANANTPGSVTDAHLVEVTSKTGASGGLSLDTGHNAMLNLQFHF
jgi:hypothetical protein